MFYPVTPCRVADTRNPNGPLGGPYIAGGQERDFPILASTCGIPATAQAYSLNFTAVPYNGGKLDYLTVWPTGQSKPVVSTLNNPTATIVANAAIVVKVLIESGRGIDNIEEIVQVPGVDLIGIGTNDLCAELGVPGDFRHARVRDAHEKALAACLPQGKPLAIGGIGDAAYSADFVRRGAAPFLMTGIDTEMFLATAHERVRRARASLQ